MRECITVHLYLTTNLSCYLTAVNFHLVIKLRGNSNWDKEALWSREDRATELVKRGNNQNTTHTLHKCTDIHFTSCLKKSLFAKKIQNINQHAFFKALELRREGKN